MIKIEDREKKMPDELQEQIPALYNIFEKSNPVLIKEHDYYAIYPHLTEDIKFSFLNTILLSINFLALSFNLPFFGEMPIPAPEVIASSVIAAGTASVVSVAGGIAGQAVLNQIKKIFKKIFTKILKKEVANVKEKIDNKKGS